eukprot:TRINITY_DN7993_c0_g1_i1.p1 TRINITY_DN7993_c0_g1~~TRINITY_DN7993_c0_g1_i1.p1  ORF type:complete len:160 (+),score=46.80 TRINITY_DN7993_c0_g1_i1:3-482(+)
MCEQAGFSVLGVADAQHGMQQAAKVDILDAAWKGQLEEVQLVCDFFPERVTGSAALHKASRSGHLQVAEALLNSKADVNAQAEDGDTALHEASRWGHPPVVEMLLEAKADVNSLGQSDSTPLDRAQLRSAPAIEARLRQAGGRSNLRIPEYLTLRRQRT